MRVTITGATGLIGSRLVAELLGRGDEITVLSRDAARAQESLGVTAHEWDLYSQPAPAVALSGRDAVVHLAGENVAQRWSATAKRTICDSRVEGTRNLIAGLQACDPKPKVLVSSSAIGYYGARGDEPIDEEAPPGSGFLAEVCVAWEREAQAATQLGIRLVRVRTGIVLDAGGGALKTMLPPFRAGVGGPVAGGRQFMSWIHRDDLVGMIVAALDGDSWSGAVNATAPEPVSNREFARALGHALHRPAIAPLPGAALRLLYGDMAEMVTTGARVLPAKALVLGYAFRHPQLGGALSAALG